MRILYFMNHADQGGAALALYDLIVEIKKNHKEIEPIVVTGKSNNLNKMFDELGVENYSAPFKNFISSYHSPAFIWKLLYAARYTVSQAKAIKQIEKYIDLKTIDIIHSNLNRIDVGAILAKKYNIPHIWHVREFGEEDFKLLSFKKDPIKYMNSFNSTFVFISKAVRNKWSKRGLNCNGSHMIYDGVRAELYTKKNNHNNGIVKGIFLGGYCESKGQWQLIEAIGRMPNEKKKMLQVDFYGNGDMQYVGKLRKRAFDLGEEACVLLHKYNNNIADNMSDYDIGFNCSRSEGFGRVTVEYMMNDLCPIVSNGGANEEIIQDGINGLVYKYGEIDNLEEILERSVDDINSTFDLGKAAKRNAIENYSMEKHANKIVGLYDEVRTID